MKKLYCLLYVFLVGCLGINDAGSIQAEVTDNNCLNLSNESKSNYCTIKLTYSGLVGGVIGAIPLSKSQFMINNSALNNCPAIVDTQAVNICKITISYKSTGDKVEDEAVFTLSNFLNKIKTNPIKLSGL